MVKTNKKTLLSTLLVVLLGAMLLVGGLFINNTRPQVDAKVKAEVTSTTLKGYDVSDSGGYTGYIWWSKLNYDITNLTITTNYTPQADSYYAQIVDVSEAQDGSLKAYVFANGTDADSNTIYDCVVYGDVDKIYAPVAGYKLFCGSSTKLSILKSINFENFDTSNVTNMYQMFRGCGSLTNITFSNSFNTSQVTNMAEMFQQCFSLNTLTLPESFDTSNVTDMSNMFFNCQSLSSLTLPNSFNTGNVTNMYYMFNGCSSLTSLNLPASFNTSQVTNMKSIFRDCSSLTSLTLPQAFDTSNVTNMAGMFAECDALKTLILPSSFNTSSATDMATMFAGCSSLTSVDLSNFKTSNVTNMDRMFLDCVSLTELIFPSTFDTSGVTNFMGMFGAFAMDYYIEAFGLDVNSPTVYTDLYAKLTETEFVSQDGDDTNDQQEAEAILKDMLGIEFDSSSLNYLDVSSFTISSTANINSMFMGLTLDTFITPKSCEQEVQLLPMYKEGTAEEVTTMPSTTMTLVGEPNSYASGSGMGGSETPSAGFDMTDLVITTTVGFAVMIAVAFVFGKTKKRYNKI